jgi:hypothetical protein
MVRFVDDAVLRIACNDDVRRCGGVCVCARRLYVYARFDIAVHTVTFLRGIMTGMLLCAMWFKLRVCRLRHLTIILCAPRIHVTHFDGIDLRPTELWFRASASRAPLRRVSTTR